MARKRVALECSALCAAALAVVLGSCTSGGGGQVTGVLGSPSATISIDGKELPPEPMKFGGVINDTAKDSKPWWPPRVVPPKGAPNVLLIMTDDAGYGVSGTFGGVIPTRRWTGWPIPDCDTRNSTRQPCARRRGQR